MYLVQDRLLGQDIYVFTHTDPRDEGFQGAVAEDVGLEYDMDDVDHWPSGGRRPRPQLGFERKDPKTFKVFRTREQLEASDFEFVQASTPIVVYSWSDYQRILHPNSEELQERVPAMTSDEWFDHLEETDSQRRIAWKRNSIAPPETNSSNEQIAEWVASRHMGADGAIDQVWYLPTGSPPNEIRLLEVNSRYSGDREKVEAMDIGLDVGGKKFRLLVADVSGQNLERIKADPVRSLPKDWGLDKVRIWNRKGIAL